MKLYEINSELIALALDHFEAANGWRWFDTSIGNRTFENSRKSENGHYFIIAQEKQYENRTDNSYHDADRFKLHYRGSILEAATPYNRNSDKYYDSVIRHFRKVTFDKSGYIQQINNYSQRVAKLKAERSEAAAALWDSRETVRQFSDRVEAIHNMVREILFAHTIVEYQKISESMRYLGYAVDNIRSLKENNFKSIESIQQQIRWTDDYLTKAENYLKEEKLC